MGVELATAYISIIPDGSKIGPEIKKQFGVVDQAASKTGQSSGKRMSSAITGTMGKVLKRSVVGVGVAAGGALSYSLFKGFGRLKGIDQAQAKLTGLGHSAKSVDKIMGNALAAVKGTAFGLDEAATTAAGAVAAGVKPGKDLQDTLTLVGDAATIAGVGMGEMGAIFNKVAASNKIQGDVINQLNDAGIPIVQLLGKELGTTAEETLKLASEGKVNFATFQKAMQSGLGGAAQESGKTFSGSLANMQAAMGRLGASILGGVFSKMPAVLGNVTGSIDKLSPAATRIGEALGTAFTKAGNVAKSAMPTIQNGFKRLVSTLKPVGSFLQKHPEIIKGIAIAFGVAAAAASVFAIAMGAVAVATSPITLIAVGLAALGGGLAYAYKNSETFRDGISAVGDIVMEVFGWMRDNVLPLIKDLGAYYVAVFNMMKTVTTAAFAVIQSLWGVFGQTITNYVRNAFQNLKQIVQGGLRFIRGIIKTVTAIMRGDWKGAWDGIKMILSGAWNVIKGVVKQGANVAKTVMSAAWAAMRAAAGKAWSGIKSAVTSGVSKVMSEIKSVPGKIKGLGGQFLSAGKSLGTKVMDGFKAGLTAVGGLVADITSAVRRGINSALGLPKTLSIGKGKFKISATIPAFARGTQNYPGGVGLVGENGPELVELPRGSKIRTADQTRRMVSGANALASTGSSLPSTLILRVGDRAFTAYVEQISTGVANSERRMGQEKERAAW